MISPHPRHTVLLTKVSVAGPSVSLNRHLNSAVDILALLIKAVVYTKAAQNTARAKHTDQLNVKT